MKKIIPKPLAKGSHLRIIAPSCSGETIDKSKLRKAEQVLAKMDLTLSYSKNLFELDNFQSSGIQSRLDDLHDAFQDKSVDGILAIRGGYNSNELLDYIDLSIIRNNPKVYCGFSDNTALQNAILHKVGLVTFSGPNLASFGKPNAKYAVDNFAYALLGGFDFNVVNREKIYVINKGPIAGEIVGGNLCTLNLLQGTQFMPSIKDKVLFLEEDHVSDIDLWEFSRNLQSVMHLPGFDTVRGIVFGKFEKASSLSPQVIEKLVRAKPGLKKVPIVVNVNFGHTWPIFTFPIGGEVVVNLDKNELHFSF